MAARRKRSRTKGSLKRYYAKRHFARTPEPRGRVRARKGRSFVIQKHGARRLHYDFRLEWDGTLKSWAVPKGPSLDPADKRLAVRVEDHPLDYGGFEGVIPEGQYGAGPVIIWDRGTWRPEGDPREADAKGRLNFTLDGRKLHGAWSLVRMSGRLGRYRNSGDAKNWLLIKRNDEEAQRGRGDHLVARQPRSVASGRTLEDVRAGKGRVRTWHSNLPTKTKPRAEVAGRRRGPSGRRDKLFAVLTHPDRVLYDAQGVTKRGLAEYYAEVADMMLPHVRARPLSLVRCPSGTSGECFYQKSVPPGTPEGVYEVHNRARGKNETYPAIRNLDGLVGLAQMGTLEIHIWGCKAAKIMTPDRIVFDVDPDSSVPWGHVIAAAREIRERLAELRLESFLKTTGGKGLHVAAPIAPRLPWDTVKAFTKAVAGAMMRDAPERYVVTASKKARKGKIFIDYLRNGYGATFVAPYSTRARPNAPISMPLDWKELGPALRSDHFRLDNVAARLKALEHDPWREMAKLRQSITAKALKQFGVG